MRRLENGCGKVWSNIITTEEYFLFIYADERYKTFDRQ